MKKIILILLLFLNYGCGYKIANNLENYNFKIANYKLSGEKKINNFLEKNFIRFQNNENSSTIFDLISNSKMMKSTTSKDSSGNILAYKLEIIIELEVFENNDLLNKIAFNESTNYNNVDSKFELKQYEDILLQNLTDQVIVRINNYLSSIK